MSPIEAPAGAPNILMILTDDVGFGASSTFGGPDQTPNFQRVGLQHHRVVLVPTRAALITRRNHHRRRVLCGSFDLQPSRRQGRLLFHLVLETHAGRALVLFRREARARERHRRCYGG